METFKTYVEKLNSAIEQYPAVNNVLLDLEKKTGVKKLYIVYGEPLVLRLGPGYEPKALSVKPLTVLKGRMISSAPMRSRKSREAIL